ncbi:MAG: hypothetical protein KF819_16015 [Labilithrix sp.]|nr:hypothetical protein [Labilithrix sp.]
MNHRLVSLLLLSTAVACGSPEASPPVDAPEGPPRVDPAAGPVADPPSNPLASGKEGTTAELIDALNRNDGPVFVVLRPGTKLAGGDVVAPDENPAARALRLAGDARLVVELPRDGVSAEIELALTDVRYLKEIDPARLGVEIDRATKAGVSELEDFDTDEEARRVTGLIGGPPPGIAPDFDCVVRFAKITASRDFVPFPLTNCSAPQPPVGDPERIADAVKAKRVADNIYNQQLTDYRNAQAMIAALQARLVAIQNAYVFIRHDPYYKEYNVTHFKDFLHGRKDYNDRYERAEALLIAAARATTAQLSHYQQVPPPSAIDARSQANRIVAQKWNCVLGQGLLNDAGRSSASTIVGVSLETLGAPFVNVQIMLDDHPPLPQAEGWGGLFQTSATPTLGSDVTRLPVSSLVPVRASVGLPIVMFRFQPLDAKKTRPVGKACNLRAGIVQ